MKSGYCIPLAVGGLLGLQIYFGGGYFDLLLSLLEFLTYSYYLYNS
jgi:hypothetical protein